MATRFSLRKSRFALIGALLVGLSAGAGCDSDMDPDPDPNPDLGDPVTPDREVIGADATVERTQHLLSDGDRCVYRIRTRG